MKTWLIIIMALTFLGGCATLDSAKTSIQGYLCPECKPVVVDKTVPCPEVQPPAPKAVVKPKATPKKAAPKLEDPYLNGVKKDKSK
jgi:hypothetical protein